MVGFKRMGSSGRPVFLDLTKIHLPLNAFVSIMHRISGVIMVLSLPLYAFFLFMLKRPVWIEWLHHFVSSVWFLMLVYLQALAVVYHALAGLRHMFHDFSSAHDLRSSKISAALVLGLFIVWAVYSGYRFIYHLFVG